MSNPYDPSQPDHQQQWGQSPYPQQPGQGYDAGPAQGGAQPPAYGQEQWGGQQRQEPQPAQPAQIDWSSAPPQPEQAPWRGPSPYAAQHAPAEAPQQFAPPAGHEQPWAAGGTHTPQEPWQPAQQHSAPPQSFHDAPQEHYRQPEPPQQQEHYQQPEPQQQSQEQWRSYDAPAQQQSQHQGTTINEAATVTTPAVADAAPEPEALTIGRGRENSIVLDDMLVSRQHVRITADADGLVLEDLGSRNGTYVNGRRVERTHLSEGDRIGIGAATFEVRDGWLLNV